MSMKTLAIISARGGSKGIPRKNVLDLGGMPLIAHIFKKALSCEAIDKVICSTDGQEIADVARQYGVDVPFMRPAELAGDRVSLIDVTKHAMLAMDTIGYRADVVVQLAPTCPFLRLETIARCIELVSIDDCECAVSLAKIEHEHPYRARRLLNNGYIENFIQDVDVENVRFHSRQDMPELYRTTGGIYARKRHLLEEYDGSSLAMGRLRKGVVVDDIEAVNIDRTLDFEFAKFILTSRVNIR